MLKFSPHSISAKLLQALLAVGYVVLVRQLLAIQASIFGGAGSGLWHIFVVLVVVALGLAALFLANFALLRNAFLRLGVFASLAIFMYYYIYNPQGQFVQLFVSLLFSPPHLINMFLLVGAPALVGKLLQSRLSVGASHSHA